MPAEARRLRRSTSPRAKRSASSPARSPSAGRQLDVLVLNAAMLGSLTPVQDIDPEGIFAASEHQSARQPGADRGLRSAAQESRSGRRRRADLFGRGRAARLLGRLRLVQGRAREPARRLCRRDRLSRPDQGPHRRPGRDPHADARQLPSRARSRKASSRRRSVAQAIVERLLADARPARRCASKPSWRASAASPSAAPARRAGALTIAARHKPWSRRHRHSHSARPASG